MRGQTFDAWPGSRLPYFVHRHNSTWLNERAVELPLVIDFLRRHGTGKGMEFGNVLMHYGIDGPPEIVDKYERNPRVVNVDILDYAPKPPLDYIVSISTLEHVGWDERPKEPAKVLRAFEHLQSLLVPGGRMLLTAPLGHNDFLDEAVMGGQLAVDRQMTLVRADRHSWHPTEELCWGPYPGRTGLGADSVWVAEIVAG